ncbi:unnamed protein product [Enterobius vermicularis]|uniref:Microphthalmia-related transcription factor b n=1 Tax=Enterobius vermicularis TaxID=51028 RepID=A0A0N4VJ65_ENTVE|nr:unnamed protein product [Enterobius vermicularis]
MNAECVEAIIKPVMLDLPKSEDFRPLSDIEDGELLVQLDDPDFNANPMISSMNMASSGYMTSSGLLNSPEKNSDGLPELDSVEEQLCNLTMSTTK